MRACLITVLGCLFLSCVCHIKLKAQEDESLTNTVFQVPDKIFKAIDKKTSSIEQKLTRQTEKYLSKIERQENRLKKRIWKKDSLLAKELFNGVDAKYNKLKNFAGNVSKYQSFYSGHIDSLSTALSFLNDDNLSLASNPALQTALENFKSLQQKLNQTDQIKNFITTRQRLLKQQFENFGMVKEFKRFQKQIYYYKAQVREYEELFRDPSRLEAKLIELVKNSPLFKQFFAKNSMLASLFPTAGYGNPINTAAITGLQSRAQVTSFIQNQMGASGQNPSSLVQKNLQSAQGYMDELRSKLNGYGNSGDLEMPDFKPNNQKTKSFFQRIEYGTDFQTQHGTYYFPLTTDLGMSIGYKLNDKNVIGLGASYKVGWGKDIRHMTMTSEGAGFRSFADINIKRSFFLSGGFEYNYQEPFNSFQQISSLNDWHQSGLIGATKIISMKTKFFKKSKIQLLWDFLSYQQRPQTQPLKFRFGFSF